MLRSKTVKYEKVLLNEFLLSPCCGLVQLRLKAIKNIGKITKSMKMIASTKLNRAQKSMETGRVFGAISQSIIVSSAL